MADQTHHPECWRDPDHHACAVREVERARAIVRAGEVVGAELIRQERERQVANEGCTDEHDDRYTQGQLAGAAEAYLQAYRERGVGLDPEIPITWPWDEEHWKPKGPLRDLIRSGALIAAEIDRLLRAHALNPGGE